ncbi:hypothetical protein [Cellulomonas fimi]|uniref:Tfp pilus assembly protein PilO n=1 Tax=Cellulomonas fimi TaxID=1708 RepID=A0A7Y0LYC4_CELFI|nr:hypothetical protein [Cellulomonas fimi]NMR20166.1 hypothetical protein [Cellulomonas fimi]
MGPKKSTWVLGTAFLGAVLVAGGWFLGISPVLASTQETRAETDSVETRNDMLRVQLATLKKQYENLDEYKAELATLAVQIPSKADLAEYTREFTALAEATGTALVEVTPGTPLDVVPTVPQAPAAPTADEGSDAATDEGAAEETSTTDEPAPAPAGVPAVFEPIPGFVAVPIDLTALGPVANVMAFLEGLQSGSQRLFLVTTLEGGGTDEEEASGGRPATARGELELTITGYIYVLKDSSAAVEEPAEGTPTPALPEPDPAKLPMSNS